MKKLQNAASRVMACMAAAAMMLSPITANAATITYNSADVGDTSVPVVATYEGTRPGALIPSAIEFEGNTGSYTVYAFAETGEVGSIDTVLNIVPQSSFTMTKQGSSETATASVSQDKTSFGQSDLAAGTTGTVTKNGSPVSVKQAAGNGTITVTGMTRGTWNGTLVFTIS